MGELHFPRTGEKYPLDGEFEVQVPCGGNEVKLENHGNAIMIKVHQNGKPTLTVKVSPTLVHKINGDGSSLEL